MKSQIERVKECFDVLDSFETREAKLYWLDVMVKIGDISKSEAGYIIHSLSI